MNSVLMISIITMKELIAINVGQFGINAGNQTLNTLLQEASHQTESSVLPQCCFSETRTDPHYRSISIDIDPYSLNQLKTGPNKDFYPSSSLIFSKDSTAGLHSIGYGVANRQLKQPFLQSVRRILETCEQVDGVVWTGSFCGGTSGVIQNLVEALAGQNYLPKTSNLAHILYPSTHYLNCVFGAYNCLLSSSSLLELVNLIIPYDNEALYRRCDTSEMDESGLPQTNQFIARIQSAISMGSREGGPLKVAINDILTNLICYPNFKLAYPSYCEFGGTRRDLTGNSEVEYLTEQILDPASRLIQIEGVKNKIAVSLFYRGSIFPHQIHWKLSEVREKKPKKCVLEEWSPLGFKAAVSQQKPSLINHSMKGSTSNVSCSSLTNSLQFDSFLSLHNHRFDNLYAKRAFCYAYYWDSFEEGSFTEARQYLAALETDYQGGSGAEDHQVE